MRGIGRAGSVVALLVGLVAQPGGATAAVNRHESVTSTGSLTYTWHGDPARGCAAAGVCGVSGEISLQPQGQTTLNPAGGILDAPLIGSATVRVMRVRPGASPSECVDVAGQPFGFDLQIARRHVLGARLPDPPASGRCAGPLGADLAALDLPVRRSGGPRPSYDLRGTRPFTAGPFSGTLVSTLVLIPTPGSTGFISTSFSSGSSSPGPVQPTTHVEYVQLDYRVSAASTSLQTQFAGSQDPSCQIFDTCGATGSLMVNVRPPGQWVIFGSRVVRGPVSRARTLRDLRQGRLALNGFGPVQAGLEESLSWPDGSFCKDSTSIPQLQLVLGPPGPGVPQRRLTIALSGESPPAADILRTHCPGPLAADLIGASGTLARGSVTVQSLLAGRTVLSLSNPGGFSGAGYDGSRSGSLELDLTLTRARTGSQVGP